MNHNKLITFLIVIMSINVALAQINWHSQTSNTTQSLRSVCFLDQNLGWAVGFNGTILHTTNGGDSWIIQASGTSNKLYSIVYFLDPNNGWVVGEFGTILHTSDAGVNWSPQVSGTINLLGSIKFTNANTGFICGNNGTILKTTNAGLNWYLTTTGTTEDLYSIYFSTESTGWAVGFNGTIIKTSDGGTNWITQNSSTLQVLNSVSFCGSDSGWIAGNTGTILFTSDGGANWVTQNSGTSYDLFSTHLIDSRFVWAAGSNGIIIYSSNSGNNWSVDPTNSTENNYSIYMLNPNLGWVVGNNGAILRRTVMITLTPSSQTTFNSDPVSVQVGVHGVVGLFAASITVSFNNSIIQCQSISNGTFLESNTQGYDVFFETFPEDLTSTDSIIVDQSILGISTVSGSGSIFNISFLPITGGTSRVKITSIILRDINNRNIIAITDSAEITVASSVVNAKIFLQGPYDSGSMLTTLNMSGVIPLTQPYSTSPWNYAGTESVASDFFTNHSNIVDWVLVELRTETSVSSTIATRAALLRNDGIIVDLDGVSPVTFLSLGSTNNYIVIKHRNHVPIMSSTKVQLSSTTMLYNFTSSQSNAYGSNALIELDVGIFGMFAGDANGNGQVQNNDNEEFWKFQNGLSGYKEGDFNLNSQVQNNDNETYWVPNNGKGTQVPN